VTIAANLDVAAWSTHHGYSALHASLDPAARAPLLHSIAQWHYVGTADRNVPPALSAVFRRRNPAAHFVEIAGFDHVCCWESIWSDVLAREPFR
jgi:pimeloyl-ACP methyl ester carboxylesterase